MSELAVSLSPLVLLQSLMNKKPFTGDRNVKKKKAFLMLLFCLTGRTVAVDWAVAKDKYKNTQSASAPGKMWWCWVGGVVCPKVSAETTIYNKSIKEPACQ